MAIDLSAYQQKDALNPTLSLEPLELDAATSDNLKHVGVLMTEQPRSGTYLLQDHHARCSYSTVEGLEVVPIAQAVKNDPEFVKNYYWNLIKQDEDQITKTVSAQDEPQGF